jgi:hypothetical protein
MTASEAFYRVGTVESGVAVYPEEVVFRSSDVSLAPFRIPSHSLVSVMNYANSELWLPDVVVVVYRNPEGRLEHFRWSLSEKGVSRELSNAIYRIIDGGFRKSFVGFLYTITHRIDVRPPL